MWQDYGVCEVQTPESGNRERNVVWAVTTEFFTDQDDVKIIYL